MFTWGQSICWKHLFLSLQLLRNFLLLFFLVRIACKKIEIIYFKNLKVEKNLILKFVIKIVSPFLFEKKNTIFQK
jgi:hypothetical protein